MAEKTAGVLDRARRSAGLSHGELWLRYFALGGMSTALQLEAYLYGVVEPSIHDHDLVAHALNERFVELGGDHPVPYLEDRPHSLGEEQQRIVVDLHDTVIQRLFDAGLALHRALQALPPGPGAERIETAIAILNEAVEHIRSTVIAVDVRSPSGLPGGD